MANDSKIAILLEAKDAASNQIKSVNQELGSIDGAAGIAAGGIGALGVALGAAGAVKLAGTVFELAETAAQAGRTRQAFDNLASGAGQSSSQMLAAMQKASGGMISNTDLVQAANRAMLLGVADSGAELGKLLEVARVRGAAMGLSVSQAFNDLVTGLGRMSPLILDNLGIVTGGEKVFDDYARSLGRAAGSLTDAEKKQALFNKVVSETQPLIDKAGQGGTDLAAPFERMSAAIQNAKQALGELFGPAVAVIAQNLADAATKVTKNIQEVNQAGNLSQTISDLASTKFLLQEAQKGLRQFQEANDSRGVLEMRQQIADLEGQLQSFRAALADSISANEEAAAANGEGAIAAEQHSEALLGLAPAGRNAAAGIDVASEAARGSISAMRDAALAAAALQIEFNNLNTATGQLAFEKAFAEEQASPGNLNRILQERESRVREEESAAKRSARAWETEMKKAEREAEKAFDDLKGKVSGILSGALDPGVGVDPDEILDKLGLRPDAVNEDARRLADVAVKGWESPWADFLKNKFPDLFGDMFVPGEDIKAKAAEALSAFQSGLVPELIDKEKAKSLVRRMIFGEQQADQLATEIAQELAAEFGTAAPANLNALVGQALGTGATGKGAGAEGGEQAGADAANSFAASFVSAASTVGSQIAGALKADSVIALIKDAGKIAGQNWGDMFLSAVGDHVPESLVSLLTDLVTPGVQARLTAQASLTGAK